MKKARITRAFLLERSNCLVFACTAEAIGATLAHWKFLYDVELHLRHRHDNQLGYALHRHKRERMMAAVPDRDEDLPLIIRVD